MNVLCNRLGRITALAAVIAGGALATATAASAEQVQYTATHYYGSTYTAYRFGSPVTMAILDGVARGPQIMDGGAGPLAALSLTCPWTQQLDVAGNTRELAGYCLLNDSSGDTIFERWQCTGTVNPDVCEGTMEYFGGTGKFEGITGEATITITTVARNPDTLSSSGYTTITGWYELRP